MASRNLKHLPTNLLEQLSRSAASLARTLEKTAAVLPNEFTERLHSLSSVLLPNAPVFLTPETEADEEHSLEQSSHTFQALPKLLQSELKLIKQQNEKLKIKTKQRLSEFKLANIRNLNKTHRIAGSTSQTLPEHSEEWKKIAKLREELSVLRAEFSLKEEPQPHSILCNCYIF